MQAETRELPVNRIHDCRFLLRLVDTESLEYIELKDSIAASGLLNPICVRPSPSILDDYEAVDGMFRLTAHRELGLTTIPALIRSMTDEEVLAAQIQANAIRPTTKPADFARHLRKILDANPGMSQAALQRMIHKGPNWIGNQLGLLRLRPEIQKAVDRGEIPLMSAYMLAKVLPRFQPQFVDLAKTATIAVFRREAAAFVKQTMEAARQGKLDLVFANEFKPQPYLRNLRDLLNERERPEAGPLLLAAVNARNPMDGWNACLDWVTRLDAESIDQQRNSMNERMKKHFSEEDTEPMS